MKPSKLFATNEAAEIEGIWVDMGDGGSVKVARVGNAQNRRLTKQLFAPHKQALRADNLSDSVLIKITAEIMGKTILLDWKGFEDDAGKPLPYSQEEAIRLLTELKDFREYINGISGDIKVYQESAEEDLAKN